MNATELIQVLMPRSARRAVVLCDGPRPSSALLAGCIAAADLFVCTDGAGRPYDDLPRPPDVVAGDFDTLGPPPSSTTATAYVHRPDQDTTDSEKALELALERGCVEAVLLGAVGGLFDHSLANAALLERFAGRLRLALADDSGATVRVADERTFKLPPETIVSLTPSGGPATVAAFEGVRWPLNDVELTWGGPSTISNHVVDTPVRLAVTSGAVLLTARADEAP